MIIDDDKARIECQYKCTAYFCNINQFIIGSTVLREKELEEATYRSYSKDKKLYYPLLSKKYIIS